MVKRILAGLVFAPALFVIMYFLPPIATGITVAFITGVAAFELIRATAKQLPVWLKTMSCACAAAIPLLFYLGERQGFIATYCMLLLIMSCAFIVAIRDYDEDKPVNVDWVLYCLFSGVAIPTFLSALVILRAGYHGRALSLYALFLAFVTDAVAYFIGMFWGKHKGVLKVSPKKSAEGYIGGIAGGVIFSLLYGLLCLLNNIPVHFGYLALCGLIGSLADELGDLTFSLIKRQYKIKDYGNLIPGHGGMLDRFDSMVFCAPVVYIMTVLLPVFPH